MVYVLWDSGYSWAGTGRIVAGLELWWFGWYPWESGADSLVCLDLSLITRWPESEPHLMACSPSLRTKLDRSFLFSSSREIHPSFIVRCLFLLVAPSIIFMGSISVVSGGAGLLILPFLFKSKIFGAILVGVIVLIFVRYYTILSVECA